MNNFKLLLPVLFLLPFCSFGQPIYLVPPKKETVFIEAGGINAVTINYEHRFKNYELSGLGYRVGAGGIVVGKEEYILEAIVSLNYLAGGKGNYFELAGGPVFHNGITQSFTGDGNSGNYLLGNVYMGYRRQSYDGGFVFRIGAPLNFGVIEDKFCLIPFPPGISFGFSF